MNIERKQLAPGIIVTEASMRDKGKNVMGRMLEKMPPIIEKIIEKGAKTDEEKKALNDFLKIVTDGRYPSPFTLNHMGGVSKITGKPPMPEDEIVGGVAVCTGTNQFYEGRGPLWVFGSKNQGFKEYLRQVREAAEKAEGAEFFKGLPLLVTKEQLMDYLKKNEDAMIGFAEAKDREMAIGEFGTDVMFMPSMPLGLTRLNGKVEKQMDMGQLIISTFFGAAGIPEGPQEGEPKVTMAGYNMGEGKGGEEKEENGIKMVNAGSLNSRYGGKDNVTALSIFYSGLPYSGLGDWGGRIDVNSKDGKGDIYKEFNLTFADIGEILISLGDRLLFFIRGD